MFDFHLSTSACSGPRRLQIAATVAVSGLWIASPTLAQSSCNNATISAWGRNGSGERDIPSLPAAAAAVTGGGFNDKAHAGARLVNGRAVCWGDNSFGQVYGRLPGGTPRTGNPGDPVKLEFGILEGVVELSAGGLHTAAVTADGRVHAWGGSQSVHVAIPPALLAEFAVSVSAGQWHSIALIDSGKVIGWGKNDYGQCGGYNAAGAPVTSALGSGAFVQAGGSALTGVMRIAAGGNHNLALKSNGSVVCWGDDYFDQSSVPSICSVSTGIGAGTLHSMAVLPNGRVVCWGYNGPSTYPDGRVYGSAASGAPLNGTPGDFVRIRGNVLGETTPVVAVAGGGSHSAACLADGTVVSWGSNADGQTNVPYDLDDVRSIDCGDSFSIALSAPLPSATLDAKVDATCSRNNGSIDVSICDAQHFSWSGPNGFQSSNEDLTNLFPGVYVLGMEGAGGSSKLYVVILDTPDTTGPDIWTYDTLLESYAGTDCMAPVPNFAASMMYSDNCTVEQELVVTQVPAAGTMLAVAAGADYTDHSVTLRVTDLAGNFTEVQAVFRVKKYPVCGCGVPDVDANGNGIPDCADVTISLHGVDGPDAGTAPDVPGYPWQQSIFKVRVHASDSLIEMGGIQIAARFDPNLLELVDIVPVAGSPFAGELNKIIDNTAGTLRYGLYTLPDATTGLTTQADLCDLVFEVPAGVSLCGIPDLVAFDTIDGVSTNLVKLQGGGAHPPVLVGLPVLKSDASAPSIVGVPANMDLPVDPDLTNGARVAQPAVHAEDDCDPSLGLAFTILLPNGSTVSAWPSGDIFPVGTSTVTYRCTDGITPVAASFTILVRDEYRVAVSIAFEGGNCPFVDDNGDGANDIVRSVRIAPGRPLPNGTVPPYQVVEVPLTGGMLPDIRIPVAQSALVSAKDPTHSLRTRALATPAADGTKKFEVSIVLIQGDSDDNNLIDILDYGAWIADRSTPGSPNRARDARSNFNGDTYVNSADFAFLAGGNFFRNGDPALNGGDEQAVARRRVSVKQLRREGHGDLAAADLNLDGWLDLRDLQLALQGVTSPAQPSAAQDELEGRP